MDSERDDFFEGILDMMKAHFGNAARAFWVYDGDLCPCCRTRKIDIMDYQGKKALSINAFMYRDMGVLIGYMLCGRCANSIMAQCKNGPTSMHSSIEDNLTDAYLCYLNSQDA